MNQEDTAENSRDLNEQIPVTLDPREIAVKLMNSLLTVDWWKTELLKEMIPSDFADCVLFCEIP